MTDDSMTGEPVTGTARAQVPARLLDLSVGGALLDLATSLEVGAVHDFALQLDGEVVWVQAEVRRCQQVRQEGFQVGVEFIGIHPHDQRRLRTYVDQRRQ
jgi:c-di-GMP-binding flagellar brake protein YcgR